MSLYVDIEKKLGSFFLKTKFEVGNKTLALLGASGCGKSITLKCIAGIEKPDRGKIILDGVTLFDSEKRINLTPQKRRTGLMLQNYALFPNMTVLQNIAAGAKRESDKNRRKELVEGVVAGFGLEKLTKHFPHQLSGGEQQRLALARLMVSDPKILLLDEPFSALDSHLRFQLEQELRQVIRRFGKTVLLVSHDRDEVFRLCDEIAVMADGRILETGEKQSVFAKPQTIVGARLTGCKNISPVSRKDSGYVAETWGIPLDIDFLPEQITAVGIRAEDISIQSGRGICCNVMESIENSGSYTLLLEPRQGASGTLAMEIEKEVWKKMPQQEVRISFSKEKVLLLRDA